MTRLERDRREALRQLDDRRKAQRRAETRFFMDLPDRRAVVRREADDNAFVGDWLRRFDSARK